MNICRFCDSSPITSRNCLRRRLQELGELPNDGDVYNIEIRVDDHVWAVLSPTLDATSTRSFYFHSGFTDLSNFGDLEDLDTGFYSTRVQGITDTFSIDSKTWSEIFVAIQGNDSEWPGLYNLASHNCATRILSFLNDLGFIDLDGNLLDYVKVQLAENGIAGRAREDPTVLSVLFPDIDDQSVILTDLETYNDMEIVSRLVDNTVALFSNCGNGILELGESCDFGADNGDGNLCTNFCALRDGWFCPENYVFDSGSYDNFYDDLVCRFNGPVDSDEPDTITFEACPWAKGFLRGSETSCFTRYFDDCAEQCAKAKCIEGGGAFPSLDFGSQPYTCIYEECPFTDYLAYQDSNLPGLCFASDRPTCGEGCHRRVCEESGGVFPDRDFFLAPYTCVYPQYDAFCKQQTDETSCTDTFGCKWCPEVEVCRDDFYGNCPSTTTGGDCGSPQNWVPEIQRIGKRNSFNIKLDGGCRFPEIDQVMVNGESVLDYVTILPKGGKKSPRLVKLNDLPLIAGDGTPVLTITFQDIFAQNFALNWPLPV